MLDHITVTVADFKRSKAFYAAFAYDPDGNNIEAVCHRAE